MAGGPGGSSNQGIAIKEVAKRRGSLGTGLIDFFGLVLAQSQVRLNLILRQSPAKHQKSSLAAATSLLSML
jgi:hypothetical protein